MTNDASIKTLTRALEDMGDKMRMLKNSIAAPRRGENQGGNWREASSHPLGKVLSQMPRAIPKQRRPARDIVEDELHKILKQTISSGIGSVFNSGGGRKGKGDGGTSVVIYNNTSSAVSARETTGPFNQKHLEITIDQMVANALVRGRQTSGVMGSLFNIVPGLIGR